MVDLEARIEKAVEEISGNEALLEMLETQAAAEMLEWGKVMAASVVRQTKDMDDDGAQIELDARLKAVRQFMRSAGNWAAGKYTDPEDRIQLQQKLLGHYKVITGRDEHLPSDAELEAVLSQADDLAHAPHQLIVNLKKSFTESL